jgi:3-oxoacyl-[acyl-carrier protein] reductase
MSAIDVSRPGRVQDAVVVVTGAANGIGRVYAEALAAEGAHVVVADRNAAGAQAVSEALDAGNEEPRSLAAEVDATVETSVEAMVAEVTSRFGHVDVLVNNAGAYPHVAFASISHAEWRRIVTQNLDSAFLCTKAVLEPMRAAGGGKVINVASNVVWIGVADMAHYTAAKAGVIGLTRALARELGPSGITVNALAPGVVVPGTRMSEQGIARLDEIVHYQCVQRPMTARDLIGPLLFLASGESDFMTGQVVTVDGGLSMH